MLAKVSTARQYYRGQDRMTQRSDIDAGGFCNGSTCVYCLLFCLRKFLCCPELVLLARPFGAVYGSPEDGGVQPRDDVIQSISTDNEVPLLQDAIDVHILWREDIDPAKI